MYRDINILHNLQSEVNKQGKWPTFITRNFIVSIFHLIFLVDSHISRQTRNTLKILFW